MSTFVITGATGFIGRHLLADILAAGHSVRALTRNAATQQLTHANLQWISGDAENPDVWRELATPGSVVVNLGYSNATPAAGAVASTAAMIEICAEQKIARMIHCSTASVYGSNQDALIREDSACLPANDYGRLKLAIEREFEQVRSRFPVVILRPTVVFGVGGEALAKLLDDLRHASRLLNYCRSSLYGRRHTHLVPVETVVAAIVFFASTPLLADIEILNVSDDDSASNDFRSVECILMEELGMAPYPLAPLPIPRLALESLLRLRHGAAGNTRSRYTGDRIAARGLTPPVRLETALRNFVTASLKKE
jgi:nucleoside-diphosphate-sugar epimerase